MGAIKHFSSSSNDRSRSIFSRSSDNRTERVITNTETKYETLPNPRPGNYKILRNRVIGRFLIVEIKYLDCTNFEGKKILVFENCTMRDLRKQGLIDPHFSDSKRFISPIARFLPTKKGWEYAVVFTEIAVCTT